MDTELLPEVETPEAAPEVAAPAAPVEESAAPKSMHEALERHWERDDKGRFAGGAKEVPADPAKAAAPAAAPAAPAVAPAVKPVEKPAEADPDAMPEGLGPKAQERFQRLVSEKKEATEQLNYVRSVFKSQEHFQQAAEAVRVFEEHRVQPQQFQQAVGFISAINRGDFAAAQQMLVEQLRQVSLMTGQTVQGVDALAEFPDIRQAVDGFQITEAHAIELARMRRIQQAQQQNQMHQQQAQQSRQAEEQAFTQGQSAVDKWARQMQAQDIDWPAIEDKIIPHMPELLAGVPPQRWVSVLQAQAKMLKSAIPTFRQPVAEPAPLRPAGAGAPQRAPSSMHEAISQKLGW